METAFPYEDFFCAEDPFKLIALNRRYQEAKLIAQKLPLTEDRPGAKNTFKYFVYEQEKCLVGADNYYALIPKHRQATNDPEGTKRWHLAEAEPYFHPFLFPLMAELTDLNELEFRQWILGMISINDGETEKHYFTNLNYSFDSIWQEFSERVNEEKLHQLALLKDDFIWNFIAIPPAKNYDFIEYPWAYTGFNVYHRCLDLLLNALHLPALNDQCMRVFAGRLIHFLDCVRHPEKKSLWELVRQEDYASSNQLFEVETSLPSTLHQALPETDQEFLENSENSLQHILILSSENYVKIFQKHLEVYNKQHEIAYSQNLPCYMEFYLKQASNLYFTGEQNKLYCFDCQEKTWIKTGEQFAFYGFDEVTERSLLHNFSVPTTLVLPEVGDYPVVNQFSYDKRYFCCLDKEQSGGIFDLKSGLRCFEFASYPPQLDCVLIVSEDGALTEVSTDEEEYELPEEVYDEQEAADEVWKGNTQFQDFAIIRNHCLYLDEYQLICNNKAVAYFPFPYHWVCLDAENELLLMLSNTHTLLIPLANLVPDLS